MHGSDCDLIKLESKPKINFSCSWNQSWAACFNPYRLFLSLAIFSPLGPANASGSSTKISKRGSIGDARNMKPGETCITYESLGSRAISGNACANKGFNTWLLIVSKLPNDEFYFNCAGKIW